MQTVDLWGNHARHCRNCARVMNKTAKFIDEAIVLFATKAGATTQVQPKAVDLLGGYFTRAECARLFVRNPSVGELASIKILLELRAAADRDPVPSSRAATMAAFTAGLRALPEPTDEKKGGGLRPDIYITNPFRERPKSILVDHFVSSITQWPKMAEQLAHSLAFRARQAEARRVNGVFDKLAPPKILISRKAEKVKKYAPLLSALKLQFTRGTRDDDPTFIAAGLTTSGFHSTEFVQVQEFLVSTYRDKLMLEGPRDDGREFSNILAEFRKDFRSTIQGIIARGNAIGQRSAGLPFSRRRLGPS